MLTPTDNRSARPTPWSRRRPPALLLTLIAFVVGIALLAVACNDGSKEASDDSNSEAESGSESDEDADPDSQDAASTDSDADGSVSSDGDGSSGSIEDLESAATACEVLDSMDAVFAGDEPTTPEQAKVFVDSFVRLVNKMAETTSDAALSQQLTTAATNLQEFAEGANYDPEAMNFAGEPEYPGSEEDFAAVNQWYDLEAPNCPPAGAAVPTP